MNIKQKEDFYDFVESYWKNQQQQQPDYWGIAKEYTDSNGNPIAYKVLTLNSASNYGALAAILHETNKGKNGEEIVQNYFAWLDDGGFHANVEAIKQENWVVFQSNNSELGEAPKDILDAHIRLALLSRREKQPNSINFNGAFGLLPNLVWTDEGPFTVEDWEEKFVSQEKLPQVIAVDKFPPFFLWNPVPTGVRAANTDMVRSGAHLAEGTTVMHYGFVNFNAGTLGPSMVEGRISAGTTVNKGTDIGAGAGFLGTLSGGNDVKMSTGKDCLVGAMAEVGVPLGDNCTVAVGTAFAPGTPVYDLDNDQTIKAIELAGEGNLLIWRNSQNGRIEVQRKKVEVGLNEELHDN